MRANEFIIESVNQLYRQGVFEGVPQPGKSSGKPISWIDPTKVVTKYLTLDEIFKSVSGIPYYNNVVTDRDNKDFTWGVTKRVIQYAKELVTRPDSYKNWPPIIVLDGKLQDGAHRISTIYLMQQRVQPNDPIWKNAKLKVEFGTSDNVKQGVAEGKSNTIPKIGINVRSDGDIDYASLIVDGKKKYESRKTDSLRPYVGKTVGIVRTGNGPAVAIGQATIGEPIVVNAEKFDLLRKKHLVPKDSKFDIDSDDTKYLYPMINPVRWENEKSIKHKGIVSRKIQESMAYINQSNKGGNLEGYVVDSNKPQLINYLSSQGADNNLINQLKQKYKTIAIIRNMYVDEDQRGQGYGNQLVSDAIDDAAGNHANAIICVADIGEDNAIDLVKWYENFGFEVVGKAGSDPVMVLEL